jgi:Asp-tRNA(Asn)/Glu-tRNA(Gln) amidotransferase A subunit family amidase
MKRHLFTILLTTALVTPALTGQDSLTTEDIKHASKLFGISFSETEIDSMQQDLQENLEHYTANRKISVTNDVALALYFNPFPPGFQPTLGESRIRVTQQRIRLPLNRDELAYYSIPSLAYLIRNKLISCVELTEFFLGRLEKYDEELHCVISYTRARALSQAQELDAELAEGNYRGVLHGIPYGLKDLFAVKGYKTTWGATPYKDQVIDVDATVVEKLDNAGAVLIAKLTLGALAWGDVWYGEKTRNPWDTSSGSSGSSAGSASSVAAGLVPFAIGTETLGSIVSPSTVCGTTGLRPTFGRVSRYGGMTLSWSMDKVGPICRSAQDCAIVFEAIRGYDNRDPSTIQASFNFDPEADLSSKRIGYVKSDFDGDYRFHAQDSAALETLRSLGFELIEIDLPPYPDITFILSVEAAAAFDELTRSNDDDLLVRQIRNAWPNVLRSARFVPAVEYVQANRLRTLLIQQMDSLFQEVDMFVHPSWASPTLYIANMTGHPTVVMPNGFIDGTPTSISITGRLCREGEILELAQQFQEATQWDDKHPEGF